MIFVALRSGFFLLLFLCLAGPSRVERTYDADPNAKPLVIVVDHSQSMTVPDQRGTSRLSSAVHAWKKVEADAIHSFPSLRYFTFSSSLAPVADLESAVNHADSGAETHLYDSLEQVVKDAPPGGYGGIVCLTDGLDTTNTTPENLGALALQNHRPLYFVVGQNQQAPRETLLVREMGVPGQVLRKSQFTATVVVEAHTIHERDVPISLWMEDHSVAQANLHLHAGANLIPWQVPVNSEEPGLLHLACRLGDGAEQESTSTAVRVVAQNQAHVLFYQGTLDWGFRFINVALRSDPSFDLTSLYNPNLSLTQLVTSSKETALTEMPDKVDGFKPFQIVVLANAFADQLSADQQAALVAYVQGGGGLLFIVSDTDMARSFSGTPLESMLPVVFEAPPQPENPDDKLTQFQEMMHDVGGSGTGRTQEGAFIGDNPGQTGQEPLKNFAFPPKLQHSKVADLFGAAGGAPQSIPKFAMYAKVHGVKSGGEVLAIHPGDKTDDNKSRALLVSQRFGKGEVTVLLTDALWRWRLSLPSTVHDPEVFWQQLFRLLSRQESGTGSLRFGVQPFFASLGQVSLFRLDGAVGSTAPVITAVSPKGQSQVLVAQSDTQAGSYSFKFTPTEPGKWHIQAEDGRGSQMETLLRVFNVDHAAELSGLPPDTDGLRKLAESTGGSLLNDGTPDNWSISKSSNITALVSKHSEPLWNNWAILLIGLGFYTTELVWRRRAKLL